MSNPTLVIGNKAYSSWSLRPWLLMKHAAIAFDEVRIALYRQDSKQTILRYSPAGRVPVLVDGSLTVWDSLAICEYLAEKHPQKQLWPTETRARANARSISAEMHSGFVNLRSQMPMNVRRQMAGRGRTPEVLAEISRIQAMWNDCRTRFGAGGPFLYGEFSVADAMYAPVVSRFHSYQVELEGNARAYAEMMYALAAMHEWITGANAETEVISEYEP
ncbi:MAG: glutathione S-transferase family protein [Betaproteobacteria bacterium]